MTGGSGARTRRQAIRVIASAAAGLGVTAGCASAPPQPAAGPAADALARALAGARIVDLTHTLGPQFPYIPVPGLTFPFELVPIATLDRNGVAANRWVIHEHIGTQVDAPSHFVAGGRSLDQFPVTDLIAPLAVIDIAERAATDPDAELTVDDVLRWEQRHGRLPENCAVFMYSGWESRVSDAASFVNADASGALHFPGISVAAAGFLARDRQVRGIGVDTLSLDPGRDATFATHKSWLGTGRWGVECVAALASVPPVGATVVVGAPKVGAATGGPVRLLALWAGPGEG